MNNASLCTERIYSHTHPCLPHLLKLWSKQLRMLVPFGHKPHALRPLDSLADPPLIPRPQARRQARLNLAHVRNKLAHHVEIQVMLPGVDRKHIKEIPIRSPARPHFGPFLHLGPAQIVRRVHISCGPPPRYRSFESLAVVLGFGLRGHGGLALCGPCGSQDLL